MSQTIEAALESARSLQNEYNIFTSLSDRAAQSTASGPLAGVPIGLKDLIDQRGEITTCGSAFYRAKPDVDATVVHRLRMAGASIIGRTGLHEFAFGFSSENPHFGPVRNPWDPNTSPGGSSGGSGAAVAAGIVPIAIGTDTGGSIRVPAAMCGCYGLKVSRGRIPIDGVFPLVSDIDTVGPLASSMSGIESAYRIMSEDVRPGPDVSSLRFGIPQPWYEDSPIEDRVAEAFTQTVDSLIESGHEVHPISMPDVVPAKPLAYAIAEGAISVHADFLAQGLEYGDDVRQRLEEAADVTPEQVNEGRLWQRMIRQRFQDAFATVDFLLTPTVPVMAKTIGEDLLQGMHYRKVLSWFTAVVNHALLPALAVPLAGTGEPPVSLQIIGPDQSEPGLLALGTELERSGLAGFVSPIDH